MAARAKKYRGKNRNRGNRLSRMTAYGAADRNYRFKRVGARGKWRRYQYKMGPYRRRPKSYGMRAKKRRSFGPAGGSSIAKLNALGKRKVFLGRIEKALASKCHYESLGSVRHSGNSNQQGYTYIPLLDNTDILQAYLQCTGGATPKEGGKVYIQSAELRTQVCNQLNGAATVWFYDIMLRRDSNDALTPNDDFQQGIQQAGGGASDYLTPYTTPFKSHRFCTKWSVRKVTKIMLNPGEEHIHTLKVDVYRSIAQERLISASSSVATGLVALGGLTHYTMVASLGGLYNEQSTVTHVGYTPQALDIGYTKSYLVSSLYDDKQVYKMASTLPAITTGSIMVDMDADPSIVVSA